MNRSLAVRAALALLAAAGLAQAQSVDQLLARLDTAAATFKGAKADMRRTSYTASIHVTDVEDGSTVIRRSGSKKLEFRIDMAGANANTWVVRDQSAEHYLPAIFQVEVWDIRKYRDIAQTLLVLGFGMSGRELAASYAVFEPAPRPRGRPCCHRHRPGAQIAGRDRETAPEEGGALGGRRHRRAGAGEVLLQRWQYLDGRIL